MILLRKWPGDHDRKGAFKYYISLFGVGVGSDQKCLFCLCGEEVGVGGLEV